MGEESRITGKDTQTPTQAASTMECLVTEAAIHRPIERNNDNLNDTNFIPNTPRVEKTDEKSDTQQPTRQSPNAKNHQVEPKSAHLFNLMIGYALKSKNLAHPPFDDQSNCCYNYTHKNLKIELLPGSKGILKFIDPNSSQEKDKFLELDMLNSPIRMYFHLGSCVEDFPELIEMNEQAGDHFGWKNMIIKMGDQN